MSWQPYIDDHLMMGLASGNRLQSAAIIGHDGNVWAQSSGFPELKPEEVENIMNGFGDAGLIAQKGLFLGGDKYMVIQGEAGEVIRGKKGAGGATLKKTTSALVLGIYTEPTTPGEVNMIVEKLGDYLIDQGY